LERAAARIGALETGTRVRLNPILLDFDPASSRTWPLNDRKYDAVLASLVISYVSDPRILLERVRSSLKPGGRLVLSTLRRDADISRLHIEGLAELRAGVAREEFGEDAAGSIDEMARNFLNDASQILDLEEAGTFQFRDLEELAELARSAGFRVTEYFYSFGEPPQAAVLVAHRD
jgi:2-polyprenyl-3-methyl-5-hydroxy-6-metoxy-1,4-benzoquinol methylase